MTTKKPPDKSAVQREIERALESFTGPVTTITPAMIRARVIRDRNKKLTLREKALSIRARPRIT